MKWITRERPKIDRLACPWLIPDDQASLQAALPLYDALYTWCRSLSGEHHGWYPQAILKEMSS